MKKKESKFKLITPFLIFIIFNINYLLFLPDLTIGENKNLQYPLSTNSDSILFNNFTYEWYAFTDNNPSLFYTGQENYSYIGDNTFQCDERMRFQYNPWQYDMREVNNLTRHFPNSTKWGDNKYDWVWIFRNTTIDTKNIPIAIIEIGGLEDERLFNVTGEELIKLDGTNYEVWVLKDSLGSTANYEKNIGILINGTFIFGGTHTWTIKMTNTNAEIPTNDHSPLLDAPQVLPTKGNLTTEFLFSVNYSDADNNLPEDINVVINSTSYPMVKQNPFDYDYIDGTIYEFRTFLAIGTYEYFFNVTDGLYNASTSVFNGPKVYYNNSFSPLLSEYSVYPLLGYNTSTLFEYKVKYIDPDNNPPIYVNVSINNTIFSMQKENFTDMNYMDGSIYTFETYLNKTGYYVYNFTASDGENVVTLPNIGYYYNPNVTLHNLNGIDIGWITTHGETPNATYSTFLNDAINLGATSREFDQQISPNLLYPFEMLMIEEEGDTWENSELIILKSWVENGGKLIIIGDNQDEAQTSVSNIFDFKYKDYFGLTGSSNQIFQPHYLTVNVNSIYFGTQAATVDLNISNPALNVIVNSSDGTPQVCYLELGFGRVLWIIEEIIENPLILQGDNRIFGQNVLRWMSDIKINDYAPFFSNPDFDPPGGDTTTFFNFSVTYTDQDNRAPIYINITLNQDSYPMVKKDPNDFNYNDGVLYQFVATLQNGTYNYYFNASDGDNEINTLPIVGPNVNYINLNAPQLTIGGVSPVVGFTNTIFKYQVNYSDSDNNEPIFVNVIIDGIPYLMEKQDPYDNYYIDGTIYEYETLLNVGSHLYHFNASDAERTTSTGSSIGPIVYIAPLTNKSIAWIRTHGELSNSSYTKILNDARVMGATITTFTSEVNASTLQDFDLIVVNEGGASWATNELKTLKEWVINGNSILILGDERDASQVSVTSAFKVFYSTFAGSSGNSSQILSPHEVTFGVSTVFFPFPECTISSASNRYITPLIKDRNDNLIVASLQYGSGRVLWVTDDCFTNSEISTVDNNLLSNNTWIWLASTNHNYNTPIINNVEVDPITGDSRTLFNFKLNYSDPDGSGPLSVNVTINGTRYLMTKLTETNYDFMSGIIYNFTIQLSPGVYHYYFNITDGKFDTYYPMGVLELTVTSTNLEAPSLLETTVTPYLGFGNSSSFTFLTTYLDLDNAPPDYVRIYIDDIQYTMIKIDPSDLSYYDGVMYQFQTTLSLGEHYYYIEAYDGIYIVRDPTSGSHLGPIIVEHDFLHPKKIGWIRSHGEYNYMDFSIYINDAIALGATMEVITDIISINVLKEYDILIVCEGGTSWSEAELNSLATWVSSGRPLFLIGDDRDDSIVSVSNKFGVYYKEYFGPEAYTSDIIQPHILTNGLNQLYTIPSASIDETLSSSDLVPLIRDIIGELLVATLDYGSGTVTWICNEIILQDININKADNRLFANNTWLWAMEPVPGIINGKEDNMMLYIIIGSSGVGAGVIIAVVIYAKKRKKSKDMEIIDRIVDDIQDKKK
ncbi:MAG: hypothetical protein ACFFEN_06470 [Candidatus Thorarchaeota archaeon]